MTFQHFSNAINELHEYFRRGRPESKVIRLWFEITRGIPSEALPKIMNHIKITYDSLPWNIGKACLSTYEMLNRNKMEKSIPFQKTPCDGCGGEGIFIVHRFNLPLEGKYEDLYLCRECENWRFFAGRNEGWPFTTKAELVRTNAEIIFPMPPFQHP